MGYSSFSNDAPEQQLPVNAPSGNGNLYENSAVIPFAPKVAIKIDVLILEANVSQSFTVPEGFTKAGISCSVAGTAVWVGYNKTAAIPVQSTSDGSSPMLNPAVRSVKGGDTLSCMAAVACAVVCEFWE